MYDDVYRESRLRIAALVAELSQNELHRAVPACPAWSISDMVAHLAGVAHDFAAGRLDGAPGTLWTRRHVRERRHRTVAENLTEWQLLSPDIEALLRAPVPEVRLAHDVVQHEADLRACVEGAGMVPRSVRTLLLDQLCATAEAWITGPGTLVLRADGRTWWIGGDDSSLALADVDGYELWRAFFGRRSRAQMADWSWYGESEIFLEQLPRFPARDTNLCEPEQFSTKA
ncbi:maleylpyruvate isomerase N-terminal domain-containing protein [Streptomyces sp. V4I23]|uniref:maleylpyruvate isomerase N-terminal domain-containing protein n=1 Tax=Streptomyces sp. V4I23 TaxID=3042282 RepID=UPI00359002D8